MGVELAENGKRAYGVERNVIPYRICVRGSTCWADADPWRLTNCGVCNCAEPGVAFVAVGLERLLRPPASPG